MGSYIPATAPERREMLAYLGLKSEEDLYACVPQEAKCGALGLPEGLSELEVAQKMQGLAARNKRFTSIFRGAGAYAHYIPSIVKSVTGKEEFLTAYTPYQAEISQGVLQSIFEYQTQICELCGMDVSNASVYDGATAAAEGVIMCEDRKHSGVVVAGTVDPQVLQTIQTYCASRSVNVTVVETSGYATDVEALKAALQEGCASVYFQSPNYYGVIEDSATIIEAAHAAGAKAVMGFNPVSLGLLATPGELGADIAVGEGQPLGLPLSFGGPYLGIMASTQAMMRKLPGRIVGQTQDNEGRRAFVLTLQAREQHIRREKASSNICSNEALCAMTASVYLAALGPQGLKQVAVNSASHAHYLAQQLANVPGFELAFSEPFFHEFVTNCPIEPKALNEKLAQRGILGGLPLEGRRILWCCTELNSKGAIDELVDAVKEVA